MSTFESVINKIIIGRNSDSFLKGDKSDESKLLDKNFKGTSISTTILLMIATGIPAGCVTVPYIVKNVGLLNFLGISLFLGIYTLMVCHAYTLAFYQTQNFNISMMIKEKLGGAQRQFFDFAMQMYMNGQLVVNYKLAARQVFSFMAHFGQEGIDENIYMVIIAIVTQVALLPKSLADLGMASQIGAVALAYLVLFLGVNYAITPTGSGQINTYTLEYSTQASAFGNMIYQYFFMNNLDAGQKELDKRSFSRALYVFYIVTFIFFVYFTLLGVFGQLTYLDDVNPTIVNNSDILSVIGRIMMFVFVNISTMVGQQGTKIMAMGWAQQSKLISSEWSDTFNQVQSAVMAALFVAVAWVTPNIVGFIDIIAGLLGCVVFSVTPPILGVIEGKNSMVQKVVFVVMSVIITQFGVLSSQKAALSFVGLE